MIDEGTVHAWSELVGRSERRRTGRGRGGEAPRGADQHPTRALSRFVAQLKGRDGPVVVDLGPALGGNVSFLGEQLGCKLFVEDVLSDLAIWGPLVTASEHPGTDTGKGTVPSDLGTGEEPDHAAIERARQAQVAARVLPRETGSVDGVLCWDIIDYLDPDAAEALAAEIQRILSPGGVLYLCHSADGRSLREATQYEIVDEATVRYREGSHDVPSRRVWPSRAILRMFGGLSVTDSFLLTTRIREIVLRKAPAPSSTE